MADKIIEILGASYSNGNSTDDIKEEIFTSLKQYFENKSVLTEYIFSSEILSVYEYVLKYINDKEFSSGLNEVLDCYNAALKKDSEKTLDIIIAGHETFSEKENMMWTIRKETPSNNGDLYDNTMSYFNYIGKTLEISVKGILYELYALIGITQEKNIEYDKIRKFDFGVVLNNILVKDYFKRIIKTRPIEIKLSDWRNIAFHNSYSIKGNEIICTYGKNNDSFHMEFDIFLMHIHQIIRAGNILNIARCIFVFDNMGEIRSKKSDKVAKSDILFRDDMLLNRLKIFMSSQGFLVSKAEANGAEYQMLIYDLINESKALGKKNLKLCLNEAWSFIEENTISISYYDKRSKTLEKFKINREM